jgi:hypothetical protein
MAWRTAIFKKIQDFLKDIQRSNKWLKSKLDGIAPKQPSIIDDSSKLLEQISIEREESNAHRDNIKLFIKNIQSFEDQFPGTIDIALTTILYLKTLVPPVSSISYVYSGHGTKTITSSPRGFNQRNVQLS